MPGKETCGCTSDTWDFSGVKKVIDRYIQLGATIVLPLATIIETGNHIAQAATNRYECSLALSEIINKTVYSQSPWAAFSDQASLWTDEGLKKLATEWPDLAVRKISIGDATIKTVAEYYAKMGTYKVEILTGDAGLKAFQPAEPIIEPRRRK